MHLSRENVAPGTKQEVYLLAINDVVLVQAFQRQQYVRRVETRKLDFESVQVGYVEE